MSAKSTFNLFAKLAITLSPLALYSISIGVSLSLDRLFLFISLATLPFVKHDLKSFKFVFILFFLILLSIFVNILTVNDLNPPLLSSYLLAFFYFIVSMLYFYSNSFSKVKIIFTFWMVFYLFFALWALYNQEVLGKLAYNPPFGVSYEDALHKRTMMGNKRLFLPYASAPFLSMITSFIVLWYLVINKNILKFNKAHVFIIIAAIAIVLMTKSRGPFYSLCLCLLLYYAKNIGLIRVNLKLLYKVVITALILFLVVLYNFESVSSSRLIPDLGVLAQSRHASLRLESLYIFSKFDFFNLLFGGGMGVIKELGSSPYSFMSYLTVLVELGVFGFIVYTFIMIAPSMLLLFREKWGSYLYSPMQILVLNLFIFLCHFFYEYKTLVPLWIVLGYLVSASLERLKSE